MPVKDFKFVSPGVFIQEIDNSFRPAGSTAIGPVVVGRSTRGLAMQPVTVQSYSEFVEMFGDTVPGNGGGDIYRDGNYQSPMYGTYAAKAFLAANVAPLTYVRLLGQQTSAGSSGTGVSAAGWRTDKVALTNGANAGGAYGLFIAPSASNGEYTGSYAMQLAAVIYVQSGSVQLSGNLAGAAAEPVKASSTLVDSDSNGNFKLAINGATNGEKVITVSMYEDSTVYIRDQLNTNPQLASTAGAFYPASSYEDYWLGETFEQEMRDANSLTGSLVGMIVGLASGSASETGPANMKGVASTEAVTGWFIGQDLGDAASYDPAAAKKLFRLVGRGHGEWLHKNTKVSIEDIRQSNTTTSQYGTFAVVIRALSDADTNPQVLERFDNLNLNPSSPNYIAKVIGDKFTSWDATNKELKTYGDYDNQSRYIRVEMNEDVDAGATEPNLLPFGFYGPPKMTNVVEFETSGSSADLDNRYVTLGTGLPGYTDTSGLDLDISSSYGKAVTASLSFPSVRLKSSATDGGVSLSINGYFGVDTGRNTSSPVPQAGIFDTHRLWNTSMVGTNGAAGEPASDNAMDNYSYIFTMDNVVYSGVNNYVYTSGSRTAGTSLTATSGTAGLLDANINKFTAPFWGGFDGFDITKPDPMYNSGMDNSSTEDNNYIYHTYRRALDTVADPDFINMNLLAVPGLTQNSLTERMVRMCEERSDALALMDLPNVYIPTHEDYRAKSARVATTPTQAANALKLRRLDSSYGTTFYPWVRTVDANTAQQVWIPPSVAMMGVLASSEARSAIWFAPAGFNRGGLSNGAAGIPVDGVTERVSSRDRDRLYEARINPIGSFPSEGIVVFGQKTLQERDSALDRINVRRLVIYLKKQISIISANLLFEQNIEATWNRFKAQVSPLLSNTRAGGGISDFRLYLDENTTTPDLVDQNIMYAKIMVKPARAIEYIAIDFVIASTGTSFDD